MDDAYILMKAMLDPVFIIFTLLLITAVSCLIGKKIGSALICFFALILLYGASIFPVSNYLSYYLEKDYLAGKPLQDKRIDVIVVLGNGAYDINMQDKTYPSAETTVRLVHAVETFRKYDAQYLVCSGKGTHKVTEAELMAEMAVTLGVPREKIRMEAKSENTWQHAVQFNKIFIHKDIPIGLVTSAFHMKRSEGEFNKFFSHVTPFPSSFLYASAPTASVEHFLPQSRFLYTTSLAIKEVAARAWYFVRSI